MNLKWVKKLTLPVLAMLFVYYGQSLNRHNFNEMNSVTSINEQTQLSRQQVNAATHHVIYGLHESNHVVRTYLERDFDVSEIQSIFQGLTVASNKLHPEVTSLIPVHSTLLDYELKDGHLILNLSEAFLDYALDDERQLLSALVWTYTELDEVDRVWFKIEGEAVKNLGGVLSVERGLTRSMGLNLELDLDLIHLEDSKLVMLYFLTDDTPDGLLVPVTRLVANQTNVITYLIESLIAGPLGQNYISVFNHQTTLLDEPVLDNGILTLNFSSDLYYNKAQTQVSSAVLRQLVMTLTELEQVENVSVIIEGNVKVFDDELKPIAIPTNRYAFDSFIKPQ